MAKGSANQIELSTLSYCLYCGGPCCTPQGSNQRSLLIGTLICRFIKKKNNAFTWRNDFLTASDCQHWWGVWCVDCPSWCPCWQNWWAHPILDRNMAFCLGLSVFILNNEIGWKGKNGIGIGCRDGLLFLVAASYTSAVVCSDYLTDALIFAKRMQSSMAFCRSGMNVLIGDPITQISDTSLSLLQT